MKKYLTITAGAALLAVLPLSAQAPAEPAKTLPAPGEIVAAAKAKEWVAIAPSDLLVMDLAPDAKGKPRRIMIQLMPPPFSQGWIGNIRKLAAAHWWDGTSINRVQDNYVTQWGDATEKKALPEGLAVVPESGYVVDDLNFKPEVLWNFGATNLKSGDAKGRFRLPDPYAPAYAFQGGFPVGFVQSELNEKRQNT